MTVYFWALFCPRKLTQGEGMCVSKDNSLFLLNCLQTQTEAQQPFRNTLQWLLCLRLYSEFASVSSIRPFQCAPLPTEELGVLY